jgi:DNA-binding MarR family transcriptional regulator
MASGKSNLDAEKLRELWERLLLNQKINVCTEELKSLNVIDINILKILTNTPGIKLKDIAKKLNIPNSTLTHAVTRLESKNFVKRALSSDDLRSFQLEVTQPGKKAIMEHRNGEKAVLSEMLNVLTEEEEKEFIRLFEKVVSCFSD